MGSFESLMVFAWQPRSCGGGACAGQNLQCEERRCFKGFLTYWGNVFSSTSSLRPVRRSLRDLLSGPIVKDNKLPDLKYFKNLSRSSCILLDT